VDLYLVQEVLGTQSLMAMDMAAISEAAPPLKMAY